MGNLAEGTIDQSHLFVQELTARNIQLAYQWILLAFGDVDQQIGWDIHSGRVHALTDCYPLYLYTPQMRIADQAIKTAGSGQRSSDLNQSATSWPDLEDSCPKGKPREIWGASNEAMDLLEYQKVGPLQTRQLLKSETSFQRRNGPQMNRRTSPIPKFKLVSRWPVATGLSFGKPSRTKQRNSCSWLSRDLCKGTTHSGRKRGEGLPSGLPGIR